MPKLISRRGQPSGVFSWAHDAYVRLADGVEPGPATSGVIVSPGRFQADGELLLAAGRRVGVWLRPDEAVEGLAYDLPRLALVALEFPKFRDGRAFSSAMLLRERYGYTGELRAVGEVVRDLAKDMVRCGFDSFEPADGSTPEQWAASALRFRHAYQAAADLNPPAWRERTGKA